MAFTYDNGTSIPNCDAVQLFSLKRKRQQIGVGGKGAPSGNGSAATCDVPTGLPVGAHTILATYNPPANDPDFLSGPPATLPYTVSKASTTIPANTFTSNPNPSTYFQPVTITATVVGQYGRVPGPTGTITFVDAGNAIPGCTGVALINGVATCSTQSLSGGTHDMIVANYSGDDNFTQSNATLAPAQQVHPDSTGTVLTVNVPSPTTYGVPVTFTATVTANNKETPTGTIKSQIASSMGIFRAVPPCN